MQIAKLVITVLVTAATLHLGAQPDTLSKKEERKLKKQVKVDEGRPLFTPLAGPAYTPEMGFTIAATLMTSFKTNRNDTAIQRSSLPIVFGASSTGALFFSSILTSYWLEDKLRINANIWYKDMPDHYWGVGYENAYNKSKSDSTTAYNRQWWWINPRFLWQMRPSMFLGLNVDYNFTEASELSAGVASDPDIQEFGSTNMNSGIGLICIYDSRDIPVNAYEGTLLDFSGTFFNSALGGDNNYQVYQLDFRQYFQIDRPGKTVALQFKTRVALGNVPYAELSQLGTPFDLRGYTWGRYRDKSMTFFIGEYRHMFQLPNGDISKHGVVAWMGTGSIADDPSQFENWLPNFGFGYRYEVQPRMNVRLDIGIGKETSGFYFNFNEAF